MNKEKFILSNEEATIIRKFRGEQEAIDRKVRYFSFLSSQHDFQNDLEFISIRTSLYKFLKNIFSIYYRWCKEHDVCFFCSLNMIMKNTHTDCTTGRESENYKYKTDTCSKNLH